jgi:hypothetical protein
VDGRPGTLGTDSCYAAGSHFECGWAARYARLSKRNSGSYVSDAVGEPADAFYAGCLDCLEAVVVALLLPAKNKRNQPSLPLVRLHQE